MIKVTTIEVKGIKFDVSVNDEGKFFAEFENSQVAGSSMAELTKRLQGHIARTKRVSIPFCTWEEHSWKEGSGRVRTGVLLGIHGSNNNILLKYDDEKKSEQNSSWGNYFYPPEIAKELQRLGDIKNKAQKEFDALRAKHKFNGKDKIKEALGAEVEIDSE